MNFRKFEVFKMEPSELKNVIDQLDKDTCQTIQKAGLHFFMLRSTTKTKILSQNAPFTYPFTSL